MGKKKFTKRTLFGTAQKPLPLPSPRAAFVAPLPSRLEISFPTVCCRRRPPFFDLSHVKRLAKRKHHFLSVGVSGCFTIRKKMQKTVGCVEKHGTLKTQTASVEDQKNTAVLPDTSHAPSRLFFGQGRAQLYPVHLKQR